MRDRASQFSWPNRTLCSVLESMRDTVKTLNFSYLLATIEEAQYLANRMESALNDVKDIRELKQIRSELRQEVRKLELQVKRLEKKTGKKPKSSE